MHDTWKRWHPIARAIAQKLLQRDQPDLTDDEVAEIKMSLREIFARDALETAVRDLLYLAAALEHEGWPVVAEKIFALVEAKPVLGALDKINHVRGIDRAEEVASSAKRFAAFAKQSAPVAGAPDRKDRKPGSLRVRDLSALRLLG